MNRDCTNPPTFIRNRPSLLARKNPSFQPAVIPPSRRLARWSASASTSRTTSRICDARCSPSHSSPCSRVSSVTRVSSSLLRSSSVSRRFRRSDTEGSGRSSTPPEAGAAPAGAPVAWPAGSCATAAPPATEATRHASAAGCMCEERIGGRILTHLSSAGSTGVLQRSPGRSRAGPRRIRIPPATAAPPKRCCWGWARPPGPAAEAPRW